jgi:hypothetical protein
MDVIQMPGGFPVMFIPTDYVKFTYKYLTPTPTKFDLHLGWSEDSDGKFQSELRYTSNLKSDSLFGRQATAKLVVDSSSPSDKLMHFLFDTANGHKE